jgi:hypothetical protein
MSWITVNQVVTATTGDSKQASLVVPGFSGAGANRFQFFAYAYDDGGALVTEPALDWSTIVGYLSGGTQTSNYARGWAYFWQGDATAPITITSGQWRYPEDPNTARICGLRILVTINDDDQRRVRSERTYYSYLSGGGGTLSSGYDARLAPERGWRVASWSARFFGSTTTATVSEPGSVSYAAYTGGVGGVGVGLVIPTSSPFQDVTLSFPSSAYALTETASIWTALPYWETAWEGVDNDDALRIGPQSGPAVASIRTAVGQPNVVRAHHELPVDALGRRRTQGAPTVDVEHTVTLKEPSF